jgi:hypothetical protein
MTKKCSFQRRREMPNAPHSDIHHQARQLAVMTHDSRLRKILLAVADEIEAENESRFRAAHYAARPGRRIRHAPGH